MPCWRIHTAALPPQANLGCPFFALGRRARRKLLRAGGGAVRRPKRTSRVGTTSSRPAGQPKMTRRLQAASSDDPQFAGYERPSRAAALLTCGCRPIRVGPSSRRYVRYRRRALTESKFDPRGFGPRLAPCLRPGALSRSPKVIPSRTPSASVRTILIPRLSVPLSSRAVPPPPRGLTSLLYVGSVPSYTWAEPPLYVGRAPPLYVGGAPSIRGQSPLYTWAEPPLYVGRAPYIYVGVAPSIRGQSPLYTWA